MRIRIGLFLLLLLPVSLSAQLKSKVLSATTTTAHSVSLAWQETATGVTFNVYRGTSTGAEVIYATGVSTLSYTDSAVTNGQKYFYFVTAVGTGGESGPSNEASVQIPSPPPAPTALAATVN